MGPTPRDYFSNFRIPYLPVVLFLTMGPVRFPLSILASLLVLCCSDLVQAAMLLRYYECSFPVVSGRNLTADFLVLWLLRSFHPLLNVPLGMGAVLQMCPGVGLPTFGCSLHNPQLYSKCSSLYLRQVELSPLVKDSFPCNRHRPLREITSGQEKTF